MATKIGSLFGDVSLRTAQFDKDIASIGKKLGGLGKEMTGLGKSLSMKLTAPLVGFGAASLIAFDKQAQAAAGLGAALKASGQEVEANKAAISGLAAEIQKVTTVGDETSIALAQVGISMGLMASDMGPALEGAVGLAEAYGISLETAMRASTAAMQGQTEALTRYIPELKNIEDPAARVAEVQQKMSEGFDVAQEKAKSGLGPMKQLGNSIGDLMEPIGEVLNEALQPMIEKMKTVVAWLSEHMSPGIIKVGVVIGGLLAIVGPLLVAFGAIAIAISAISLPVVGVVAGVLAFGAALVAAWEFGENVLGPWLVDMINSFDLVWQAVKNVAGGFKVILVAGMKSAWEGMKSYILDGITKVMSKISDLWKSFGKITGATAAGNALGGLISDVAFRAEGGPVTGGSPYIVGEQGPELFIPRYSGNIVPNHGLGGAGGGTVIHQHFNGNMDMAVVSALKNMKPTFVKWAVEGVRENSLRTV